MAGRLQTKNKILQTKAEEWRRETGADAIDLAEVAAWLIREKHWTPRPTDANRLLRRELQAALREQYITDPQGRRVRQKHAEKVISDLADGTHEQQVLWRDIREASRPQMQAAFQQRRHGIVQDCHRLRTDVDSYNENWNSSTGIQLEFDFREDLLDLEHGDDAWDEYGD